MRIDPSSGFSPLSATAPGASGAVAGGGGSKAGVKVDGANEDAAFTPTPDLARLLAAVKELPSVRADVVAEASDKLASGELLTPTAATETAQAILATQVPIE